MRRQRFIAVFTTGFEFKHRSLSVDRIGHHARHRKVGGHLDQVSIAALAFDHQNPGLSARVRNVLAPHSSEKHVADLECHKVFGARFAIMHVDSAIENCEYLFTVVDMPLVWLVGPVETRRCSAHIGDVVGTPCARGGEIFAPNNSHRYVSFEKLMN
jgi:hypothetical protein